MKKIIYTLQILILFFLAGECFAQTPTYNLKAENFRYYGCPANILEFDIYMEHTNPPTVFEYSAGQYFFDFNPLIANGGTLKYQIVGSDFPVNFLPQNPQISGSELRLASNFLQGPGNGYIMTNNGTPGTKIARMRLSTTASSFSNAPLNLQWRSDLPNPYTKIFAYIGTTTVEISTPNTHSIEYFPSFVCESFLLNAPAFNSVNNNLPVTFSWYRAINATDYKLQVASDSVFNNLVFNDSNITDSFKVLGGLNQTTRYYWKVLANVSGVYNDTSSVWFFSTGGSGGVPTYLLTAMNFQLNSPQDNQLEFDIYMQHTNPPTTFEYSAGQYDFNFNPMIANGGTLTYELIGSDLPANIQPRSPTIAGSQLRLAPNAPQGSGNGFIMTNNGFPGTKIARMRLTTSASSFAVVPLNLSWRNVIDGNPYTIIDAYIGTANVDITTPNTHTIDTNLVLPVELSEFTSIVNKNNVTLNWTTSNEINNSGFDIEKKLSTSNEWNKTGFVNGNGNSNKPVSYSFSERANSGRYNYRLKQIDFNGSFKYYDLSDEVEVGIPKEYSLSQNYPNPFNPSTKIDYELPSDGKVSLVLYDISGREAATVVNEFQTAGYYTTHFNASNLSSGIYFYIIRANNFQMTKKMMLVK
jgi:Secretion system C-terminal sorting domain